MVVLCSVESAHDSKVARSIPSNFSGKKFVNVAEVNQQHC